MSIIITVKDNNGQSVIDALTGMPAKAEVSETMAASMGEYDSYIKKLEHIDERHFGLLHFEDQAWDNLQELSTGFSTEDKCLGTLEETAAAERAHYLKRLDRCRLACRLLRESCTPTQWRRLLLHRYCGLTVREVAAKENKNIYAIQCSLMQVEKKIRKILMNSILKS